MASDKLKIISNYLRTEKMASEKLKILSNLLRTEKMASDLLKCHQIYYILKKI